LGKRKTAKSKRPTGHKIIPGDYVLVLEGAEGDVLATLLRTDYSWPPLAGEGCLVRASEVRELPHLAGSYRVHFVDHRPPPDGTVTIADYSIPWCYARPSRHTGVKHREENPTGSGQLAALNGDADRIAALAEDFREFSTELNELRDKVALATREGGRLDPTVPEQLHDLSRRAKQRYSELTISPPSAKV
jgi:hypothetical protein